MAKSVTTSGKRKGKNFAVVVSRFNDFVTQRLLKGCLAEFSLAGVSRKQVTVVWVPGSFEIPVVALQLARKKKIDAVVCLGAVIRGETMHFELVARAAADGIAQAGLLTGKPVIFGVLSTDTVEQAYKRSDEKGENKGSDAARNAVEMAELLDRLKR